MNGRTALPLGMDLRRATRADNPALLAFVAHHAMEAGVALRFDRGPDFFALLDAHSDEHETWVLVEDGRILGMGTLVPRPGYIRGCAETVVYLGELRVSLRREIAGLWRALLGKRLAELGERLGVRYAYCCVMRANHRARAAVLRERARDDLKFAHLRGYSSVALLARKPGRRRSRGRVAVRRATVADSENVRALLDADARERDFGVVFDAPTWARRLSLWPSFGIDSFYLAVDEEGALRGCVAPWESSALNRLVIERLPAAARWTRSAYNALAPLTGKPRIPVDSDSHLPDVWLTHIAVVRHDPEVFAVLLDAAYADLAATRRYATVSLCAFDADPLAHALDRYWRYAVPMDVYSLQVDALAPPLARSTAPPGFEIYLV